MSKVVNLHTARPSTLASALELAARKIRVFPLAEGASVPPKDFLRFQEQATTDPAKIRAWWTENPRYNIGVATGRGLTVVDVDVKKGKKGAESLEALELMGLPLNGYKVATPSGGLHAYLQSDHPHRNSVEKLPNLPGIDIRGEGGYVVGAGSVRRDFPGKPYTAAGDTIPRAPDWFDKLLIDAAPKHAERTEQPLVELDQPHNVDNAIAYLVDRAPQAIEGAGGNDTTYKVAGRMRDYGLSEAKAWEVMLDHWNEHKASPVWEPEELLSVVQNAYRYATGAWGGEDPSVDFCVVDDIEDERPGDDVGESDGADGAVSKKSRFVLETLEDLAKLPKPKWLVDGWFPEDATGILYGKWGSGKSFLAFDLGLHIAYGLPNWHGAEVSDTGRKVLVLAREGHQGFVDRAEAFRRRHKIASVTENFVFMRTPVNFMHDADFKALEQFIRGLGVKFALVIVDTVARVMAGADMSAPEAVTTFMERCDRLAKAAGGTVIGVHHENKSGTMMGSTFFEANADFVYGLTRENADSAPLTEGTIKCTKMKDGPDGWSRSVKFTSVEWEAEGEYRSSLAIDAIQRPGRKGVVSVSKAAAVLLECLERKMEAAGGGAISWAEWQEGRCRHGKSDWKPGDALPDDCGESTLRKRRRELLDAGFVYDHGRGHFATIQIEAEAA